MTPMVLLQLSQSEQTLWLITLGIGLVVIAVVIALLSLLIRLVNYIDRGVLDVWETATKVAANTATTWQLNKTLDTVAKIKDEVALHDQLLEEMR